jgi:serralysin
MATFIGTNGNNNINGTGFQIIFGLGGNDTITSDFNIINSEIFGGDGNDAIDLSSPGSGFVDGGAGSDIINGSNSADALYGGSGDDAIDSVVGDDFVDGGDGNDTITLGAGGVALGGAGNDTIVAGTFALTVSARLFGGAGNDTIEARLGGSDDLYGEDGDDLFITAGNDGSERYYGGAGSDTVSYATVSTVLSVNLATGAVSGPATGDLFSQVENLIGGSSSDTFTGDANANTFRGGDAIDILDGAGGIDTASFSDKTLPISVVLDQSFTAFVSVNGTVEDNIKNFENVIGGLAGDSITGDALGNFLDGGGGADTLTGAGGNDVLKGGLGVDALRGGIGDDTYVLENGSDTVQDTGGIDTAASTITRSLAGGGLVNVEKLVLVNVATALNGVGNGLANVLNGNNFNNTLDGGANNDTLLGNGGNDVLFGRAGNDVLSGGLGNDLLVGGLGRDIQTGGAGNDIFRFSALAESLVANPDIVTDFDDAGDDRIDVSTLFGAALTYRHNGAFTAAGQLRINDIAGADVIVQVNTGGSLAADFAVRLTSTTLASMSAGDFFL